MSAPTSSTLTAYTVTGMTCAHCVSSVTHEVGKIPGVVAVDVDLPSGLVNVESRGTLDDGAVAAAVTEAGYEVVAAPAAEAGSCCGTCH